MQNQCGFSRGFFLIPCSRTFSSPSSARTSSIPRTLSSRARRDPAPRERAAAEGPVVVLLKGTASAVPQAFLKTRAALAAEGTPTPNARGCSDPSAPAPAHDNTCSASPGRAPSAPQRWCTASTACPPSPRTPSSPAVSSSWPLAP